MRGPDREKGKEGEGMEGVSEEVRGLGMGKDRETGGRERGRGRDRKRESREGDREKEKGGWEGEHK